MYYLSKTDKFDLTAMCLTKKEKNGMIFLTKILIKIINYRNIRVFIKIERKYSKKLG